MKRRVFGLFMLFIVTTVVGTSVVKVVADQRESLMNVAQAKGGVTTASREMTDNSKKNEISIVKEDEKSSSVGVDTQKEQSIEVDAKNSNLSTEDGAANYDIEVVGESLLNADTQFRTVDVETSKVIQELDIYSYLDQTDSSLEFSLADLSKELNPKIYMNKTVYAEISLDGGQTWQKVVSTKNIDQKESFSSYESNLTAKANDIIYYSVEEQYYNIDGKKSVLTTDAEGNYIVEVSGEGLESVEEISFRVVTDLGDELDTFTIDNFTEQSDGYILFSLNDNSKLLQPKDYLDQTIHAQISFDGKNYINVTSTERINLEEKTSTYDATLTADRYGIVYYSVKENPLNIDGKRSEITIDAEGNYVVDITGNGLKDINEIQFRTITDSEDVIDEFTIGEFSQHTDGTISFNLDDNADLLQPEDYVGENAHAQISFDGDEYLDVPSSKVIDLEVETSEYVATLEAEKDGLIYYDVEENFINIDGKRSEVTTDAEGNYIVDITGNGLKDIDEIEFRTITNSEDVIDEFTIDEFSEHTDEAISFSLDDNSDLLQPEDYIGEKVHAQISFDGDEYLDVPSSKVIDLREVTSEYVATLEAKKDGLIYYDVEENFINIDGKRSEVTTDAEGNYIVDITGNGLKDIDEIEFRTITDSKEVLDEFIIDEFSEHTDEAISFSLDDNSDLLQPEDYVGQRVYAQISFDGDEYLDVPSSKVIDLEEETETYTTTLKAERDGLIYYEVSTKNAPIFEIEDSGNVIAYDIRDYSKIEVDFVGSQVKAVEGLAWDEEEEKLYYAADMKEDGMFSNDSQDIYVLTHPVYEDGVITFKGKDRLYNDLTVSDPYNHDTNSLNEGAAYNKNMDSYDFTYRKSDGLFGGKPHDIKVSYAANGSGSLERAINFTSVVPGYNDNRAYDIAYDHIHDQYVIAMGGSGVITSSNGSVIYTGKANGLAVRGDYLHIVESDGNYEIYDLNTYQPVYSYDYNLPTIRDAA